MITHIVYAGLILSLIAVKYIIGCSEFFSVLAAFINYGWWISFSFEEKLSELTMLILGFISMVFLDLLFFSSVDLGDPWWLYIVYSYFLVCSLIIAWQKDREEKQSLLKSTLGPSSQ